MSLLLRLFVPFALFGLLISGFAIADESDLRKTLQTHFPDSEIESLTQTPYQGLYEVVIGGEVFYTDEKADFLFMGHMVDTKTRSLELCIFHQDYFRINLSDLVEYILIYHHHGNYLLIYMILNSYSSTQ